MNVQPVKKCYYNSLDTEHSTFRCTHMSMKLNYFVFCFVLFFFFTQGAFGLHLSVYDDDSGNLFGIGSSDDHVDSIGYGVTNVPAQKDLQSAVAKSISVRKLHSILFSIAYFRVNCGIQGI